MRIIGITGQSGSGKGYLSAAFADLGYIHADADAIYHALLKSSDEMKSELVSSFGNDILNGGEIDRTALGAKVLGSGNEEKLALLNSITHKYVYKEYMRIFDEARTSGHKGVIVDAPLLIEAQLDKLCDVTVCVTCDKEIRIARIMARDKIDRERALLRINSQKPLEFYTAKCSHIFLNDGSGSAARFAADIDRTLTEDTDE